MLLNRACAVDYMDRYGLDAIIASSYSNVSYFTDFDCFLYRTFKEYMSSPGSSKSLIQSFGILPRDGEHVLIIGAEHVMFATDVWVKDIRTYGESAVDFSASNASVSADGKRIQDICFSPKSRKKASEVLLATLREKGLERSNIGVDTEGLSAEVREALLKGFPAAKIRDCSELVRLIRMVKSKEEIQRLTKAAEINERALEKSVSSVEPGMTASEISQMLREEVVKQGGVFKHFLCSPSGFGITSYPNYVFKEKDVLFFDSGCAYELYHADTGLTVFLRRPNSRSMRIYYSLRDTISAVLDAVKPGVRSSTLHDLMMRYLKECKIEKCPAHGHGIGIEMRDYPIITEPRRGARISDDCVSVSADLPLQEGMVINFETPYFLFGIGSFNIECTVLVTAKGYRELTPQDRRTPIMVD